MKTEKRKNSALKKLIPAVAMLATSAVMLSTATYAWFTMNKEVKMTGLNMTATVGEGIEIALAEVADNNGLSFTYTNPSTHPSDSSSNSWKSAVVVGNYYTSFGKIKPSSSENGTTFFDATDASQGGKVASTFKKITDATTDTDFIVKQTSLNTTETVGSNDKTGYYIDIPVHIRTSKVDEGGGEGDILFKMKISDATNPAKEGAVLYKAVRVAFITGTGESAVYSGKVYGINNEFYTSGKGAVTSESGDRSTTLNEVINDGELSINDETLTAVDSGLKIPYATTSGSYGHLDFVVRVWLEGESTSCYDEQAAQSWNIDLAFSLKEETT
ncbi:MAG: hypothetical protein ACI4J7_05170 [Ruminiclostridium sp.]